MKIKKIKIENFLSFSGATVNQLSNFNMFYGYNNSGKSNLLKFIELLFSRKTASEIQSSDRKSTGIFWDGVIENCPFIFRNNNRDDDIKFEIFFEILKVEIKANNEETYNNLLPLYYNNNHRYVTLHLKGKIKSISDSNADLKLTQVLLNKKIIYSVKVETPRYFESVPEKSKVRTNGYQYFLQLMSLLDDCVLFLNNDRFFKSEQINKELRVDELSANNFKSWLYNLYMNPQTYSIFKDLLDFIKTFRITHRSTTLKNCEYNSPLKNMDVGFAEFANELEIMLENPLNRRLPLSNYGTGIQQLLYIITKIFVTHAKIILIEEIELNLSPIYQRELLRNFKRLQEDSKLDQILFTTHSKYFNFRNDFSIYEVTIKDNGVSDIDKIKAFPNNFFNVRNLD